MASLEAAFWLSPTTGSALAWLGRRLCHRLGSDGEWWLVRETVSLAEARRLARKLGDFRPVATGRFPAQYRTQGRKTTVHNGGPVPAWVAGAVAHYQAIAAEGKALFPPKAIRGRRQLEVVS